MDLKRGKSKLWITNSRSGTINGGMSIILILLEGEKNNNKYLKKSFFNKKLPIYEYQKHLGF